MGLAKNLKTPNLEYVLFNGIDLWEIDYVNGSAIDVSEVMTKDLIKKTINYVGSIEEYLRRERNCKNVHFHDSISGVARAHIGTSRCTFDFD